MTTTTPNMNLILPDVMITTGPQWATLIDAAYTLIDSHDHSTSHGVRITPSGINISSDLTFAQNNATNLRTARFFNNSAITLGVNDKTCFYTLNNELYFVDGAGNNIQLTLGGGLNFTASITALTLKDTGFFLEYFGDVTKKLRFDVSSIPTATTRILSVPDSGANDTFLTVNATQSVVNKTLTSSILSGNTASTLINGTGTLAINSSGTQTIQNGTDTIVSRATNDTLTNKILTGNTIASFTPNGGTNTLTVPAVNGTLSVITAAESPTNKTFDSTSTLTGVKIASFTSDGTHTITVPTVTDTLVAKTTTDTLTNKTLTSPVVNSATLNTPILPTYEDVTKIAAPATPASGNIRLYANSSDGLLHFINSAGADAAVGTGTSSTSPATATTAGTITKEATWQTWSPTFVGLGTVTNVSAWYKILGDSVFYRINFTTGTIPATIPTVTIPVTIATAKLPPAINSISGRGANVAANASQYVTIIVLNDTTKITFTLQSAAQGGLTTTTADNLFASSASFSFQGEYPI